MLWCCGCALALATAHDAICNFPSASASAAISGGPSPSNIQASTSVISSR
jgi:hypothetical protein